MGMITINTQEGHEFTGSLKTVTQERVNNFSGGFPKGPGWPKKTIHTDLDFAKSCGLHTRVASGAMCEGYLVELMIDVFGIGWLKHGKMALKFIGIIKTDDTVLPKAVVQSKEVEGIRARFVMQMWCENQDGKKVVVGTAAGLAQ